jgi:hypothetical protein
MCTQINHISRHTIAIICLQLVNGHYRGHSSLSVLPSSVQFWTEIWNSECKCNAALPLWCGHTSGNRNHPTTSSGSVRDDDGDVDVCQAHSAASGELTAPADQKEATACPAFPSGLAWNESLPTGRQLHQSASAQADNTTEWQQLPSSSFHGSCHRSMTVKRKCAF